MTNPMLAELDEVVRLMEAASFVDLDWGWRRDDDDTPGSIFTHSFGGMHQAVAMCPRYGKDSFAADASYIVALHNFLCTYHASLADMAKRLEAAERDARRYRWLRSLPSLEAERVMCPNAEGGVVMYQGRELDKRIDATQEGEGCGCRSCNQPTWTNRHFVVCPKCGNKRCPKAENHEYACTGSNEPGQVPSKEQEVE